MVLGILTLLGGCFVMYQTYTMYMLQSVLGGYFRITGSFFLCGLGMILAGALSIANENKKSADYALRCILLSAAVSLECFISFYGDLQIWAFVNIGLAVVHFLNWRKFKAAEPKEEPEKIELKDDVNLGNVQTESTSGGILKKLAILLVGLLIIILLVLYIPSIAGFIKSDLN